MQNKSDVDVEKFVASHRWFHTINLGGGIMTPGGKRKQILDAESEAIFSRVKIEGRSVLDVGAWNGYYTVEAHKRGARRLAAIDHFTWESPFYRGKETFDFVMDHLGIDVETRVVDVQNIDSQSIGSWDIVLFLGVFYHLLDPITAIMRLAPVVNEVLIVETWLDLRSYDRPAMVFYPGRELSNDPTNWWGPNRLAVEALLRIAGFNCIEFMENPAPGHQTRGIFHAYKTAEMFERHVTEP